MMPPPNVPSSNTVHTDFRKQNPVKEYSEKVETKLENDEYDSDRTSFDDDKEKKNCGSITSTLCLEIASYPK